MPTNECTRNCWIAGAVLGLFVWILTSGVGTMRWFEGLFLAIIAGALMGAFLVWALCSGRAATTDHGADRNRARASAAGSGGGAGTTVSGGGLPAKATTAATTPKSSAGAAAPAKPVAAPTSPNPSQGSGKSAAETKSTKHGSDKSSSDSEAATQSAPATVAAGTTPAAAPASTDSEAGSGGGSSGAAKAAAASSDQASTATAAAGNEVGDDRDADKAVSGSKADKPTPSKSAGSKKMADRVDNLKEIKGVGPKLEKMLHDEGVTSFAQIASWTESDIDQFAEKIGSMGSRIRSDDWVAQAKTLAEGGETDFSRRVDKGDVY